MSVQKTTKAMLSLGFRTNFKNLSALISKTEAVNNFPFITLHRTICTARIMRSRNAKRKLSFNELNTHENFVAAKEPKEFGKTFVLNPDEVEEDDEDINYRGSNKVWSNKKGKGLKRKELGEKQTEKIDKSVAVTLDEVGDCNHDDEFDSNEPKSKNFTESKTMKKKKNFNIEKKLKKSIVTDLGDLDHNYDHGDEKTSINFETLKPNSHILCSTISNLKSRKKREKLNKILIEGRKLIYEAITAGCQAEMIFFTKISDVKNLNLPQSTKLFRVSYKDIQLWSDVNTTQGIIGVFQTPKLSFEKNNSQSLPLTVICDNIRDPGNMGSILRVATSVGCKKIILTKACVDIWSLKVTRAAAGAHFQLPIVLNLTWPEIANEVTEDSKIILATNVRGTPSEDQNDDSLGEQPLTDDHLPSFCYLSQNYCNGDVVIVIGSESHGISQEALQFAAKRKGVKVHIPMSNNIESLNSGVAFAILSYEIRRQVENATKNESQVENSEKESNSYQESSAVQSN